MREDIRARVRTVLAGNILKDINTRDLGDDTPLLDFGVGVDSVARLEFLVALEEEFGVKLDESDITPGFFETVESISDHISRRLG
jgi:acyl carrier protein